MSGLHIPSIKTPDWERKVAIAVNSLLTGSASPTDADTLDGLDSTHLLDRANHTGSQAIITVTGLQGALDDKYDASNPDGYISGVTGGMITTALGYTPTSVTGLAGVQSVAAFKTGLSLVKADVGLGSADNTSDLAKPVSTATQTALDTKITRNACMVRKAANETADYSATTAIPWDQEAFDDGGWHDNATNNARMTVPAGVTRVRLGGSVRVTSVTASTNCTVQVLKNGVDTYDGSTAQSGVTSPAGNSFWVSIITGPLVVTPGDYFTLALATSGDTSVTIDAVRSNFWIEAC